MTNLNVALRQLQQERRQAQTHMERLDQAIAAIAGMVGRSNSRRTPAQGRSRLSPAARRRIAAAQRARWARHRQQAGGASAKSAKRAAKRRLSPAARRRIAAAQKARWARFRQQQKAAA